MTINKQPQEIDIVHGGIPEHHAPKNVWKKVLKADMSHRHADVISCPGVIGELNVTLLDHRLCKHLRAERPLVMIEFLTVLCFHVLPSSSLSSPDV